MSSFAVLIGVLCICSAAVSALGIISPNGMTEKTLNLVIGVFVICVMLVPIKNFITDFNFNLKLPDMSESISSDAQKAYNNAVVAECEARLENSLMTILKNNDFSVNEVEVKLGKKLDGGIYVSGINIYIYKGETRINKIIRMTEEEFKVTPEVIVRQ